jgi:tetratricopeptide (TPR) repeat protein
MRSHEEAAEEMDRKVIDAITCTMRKDYNGAISIISGILDHETYADLRCDAYGYRATFYEKLGKFDKAIQDWLSSYSLVTTSAIMDIAFKKYVTELRIGGVFEKQSKMQEAMDWYRKALTTVCEGEGTSGGAAIKSFLTIVGDGTLTDEDRTLCNDVVAKSWKLLHIEGEPDLSNPLMAAEKLIQAQGKPRPRN